VLAHFFRALGCYGGVALLERHLHVRGKQTEKLRWYSSPLFAAYNGGLDSVKGVSASCCGREIVLAAIGGRTRAPLRRHSPSLTPPTLPIASPASLLRNCAHPSCRHEVLVGAHPHPPVAARSRPPRHAHHPPCPPRRDGGA